MMLIESTQTNLLRVTEKNQMDKALKQRLVGASVLIILAVIVLPMLLSGRSDRLKQESRQIELPPKPDELSIETRRFPVGVPARPVSNSEQGAVENEGSGRPEQLQTDSTEIVSDSIEMPSVVEQQGTDNVEIPDPGSTPDVELESAGDSIETPAMLTAESEEPAVTSVTPSSVPEKTTDASPPVERDGDTPRYLVQVASFSNEKNANALAGLLKAENLSVLMDVVDRPAGRMYRVRVGPYAKRPEADAIVSSLRRKMTELNPRVLDLRPDESAPVSTPSDPLVRWVVQVGSFSSSKSAQDLVARLRLEGLSAFSEKVSSATATAYKVRIGPELDRDKATEMARKVKAEHNIDAFVTTLE